MINVCKLKGRQKIVKARSKETLNQHKIFHLLWIKHYKSTIANTKYEYSLPLASKWNGHSIIQLVTLLVESKNIQ